MMNSNRVTTALEKARALVVQGWTKGQSKRLNRRNGRYQYCATGAIDAVARDNTLAFWARRALDQVRPYKNRYGTIVSYNDAKSTKKADILRVYDRAIKATKTGKFNVG